MEIIVLSAKTALGEERSNEKIFLSAPPCSRKINCKEDFCYVRIPFKRGCQTYSHCRTRIDG